MMKKIFVLFDFLLWVSCVAVGIQLSSCTSSSPSAYYIDPVNGNDANSGRSVEEAWQSLEKVKNLSLTPGEQLLLKRGATFNGELEICGKGTAAEPVVIASYGDEKLSKPCIVGNDTSLYAARIFNSEYLIMRDLEIVNTGKQPLPKRTGLKIECKDYGIAHNIRIDGLTIRDVNGSYVKQLGGGSGIYIVNEGEQVKSCFDSLVIENCHILRCARNAMIWSGYHDRRNWYPSKHTVVRGNLIEEVPGDGIVPIGCDSTLIEYNVMRNCPDVLPMTEAAAGFWPWSCDNTTIQFNHVSGHKAPWDAQAYDCDYNCRNTVIQYNYSHDNYGGLALVCDSGNERTYSLGNQRSSVRYNISIGDGIRPKLTRQGMFSPSIHIAGRVEDTRIERNIIHANAKPGKDIDRSMIVSDNWDGYAARTTFSQNIFYAAEPSHFDLTQSTDNVFEGNWYLGTYTSLPNDPARKTVCQLYEEQILSAGKDGYKGLENLMKQHTVCGIDFLFVDKESIENFFNLLLQ